MGAQKRPKLRTSELKGGAIIYHYRRPSTLTRLKQSLRAEQNSERTNGNTLQSNEARKSDNQPSELRTKKLRTEKDETE